MATHKNWKRGLLRAWLALSLLWAAGLMIYLFSYIPELFDVSRLTALLLTVVLLYPLPLGAIPPVIVLASGALICWGISMTTVRNTDR